MAPATARPQPSTRPAGGGRADLLEGVEITGASKVHELVKNGAATLSF
jgi:hypothetical protein